MPRLHDPSAVDPDVALARLLEGNQRFVSRSSTLSSEGWRPGLSKGQRPFAVLLGCSDSRSPAELVFDQGLGDLFVIRIAGNVIAPSGIGSVEFALSEFGTRLVVVMGHTHCGAIDATLRAIVRPDAIESSHVRSITDRIRPHVRHLLADGGGAGDPKLQLQAMRTNVLAATDQLRHGSQLIENLVVSGWVKVIGAEYDLDTGVVSVLPD